MVLHVTEDISKAQATMCRVCTLALASLRINYTTPTSSQVK